MGFGIILSLALVTTGLVITTLGPIAWAAACYGQRDRDFPLLWQYRTFLDGYFLTASSSKPLAIVRSEDCGLPSGTAASAPKYLIRVNLDKGDYPGIAVDEPHADWRGQGKLSLDLMNPGTTSLKLTVRVHDRQHKHVYSDRFNRQFVLEPGMHQVSVPVADIEHGPHDRLLDMANIAGIMIFSGVQVQGASFCLARVQLLPTLGQ
jgi:hypothetical protein